MSKRIVLFLGAGASVPYGYPTTDGILARIEAGVRAKKGEVPAWVQRIVESDPHFCKELLKGINLCLPGHSNKGNGSIIDVLSVIEYLIGAQLSLHPSFGDQELRLMRRRLNIGMSGALHGQRQLKLRDALVQWIMAKAGAGYHVTIVTTNYDCVYDLRLAESIKHQGKNPFKEIDFGTTVRSPSSHEYFRPKGAPIEVFKLHGSLNWLQCEQCSALYVNATQRIDSLAYWTEQNEYNSCTCLSRLSAVLVAPSLIRDVRNPHLLEIWNAALSALRKATEWNFIGYSLPQEDIAIRALLLRAMHGRTLKKLKVRLALWDPAEQKRRAVLLGVVPAKEERQKGSKLQAQQAAEVLAVATLKRYSDFLPRQHFRADEHGYFPGGVAEIVEHLTEMS